MITDQNPVSSPSTDSNIGSPMLDSSLDWMPRQFLPARRENPTPDPRPMPICLALDRKLETWDPRLETPLQNLRRNLRHLRRRPLVPKHLRDFIPEKCKNLETIFSPHPAPLAGRVASASSPAGSRGVSPRVPASYRDNCALGLPGRNDPTLLRLPV